MAQLVGKLFDSPDEGREFKIENVDCPVKRVRRRIA